MTTKLTLRIDHKLIESAKAFAKNHDKSVSKMVSDYFSFLQKEVKKDELPPVSSSLVGLLDDKNLNKQDYKNYLEEKYF